MLVLSKQKKSAKLKPNARRAAIAFLARREHSVQELLTKLQAKSFDGDESMLAVTQLTAADFQSDARFAAMLIRSRMHKGHGALRISAELRDRGVLDQVISQELEKYSNQDWLDCIKKIYYKKFGEKLLQNNQYAINWLLQRGFSYSLIQAVKKS